MHSLFYIGLNLRVDDDVAKTGIKWVKSDSRFQDGSKEQRINGTETG